jgi:5-carboxymethyl-2-hydroxymuconate isomerase
MTAADDSRTSTGSSLLEAQITSLLQRLDRHREQRCREILDAAESQARVLERDAWREAGARGRVAVADARIRLDAGRHQARAQLAAARRQQAQAQANAHLEELWRLLPAAVASMWTAPQRRQRWLQSALRLADATLVGRRWRVESAPGAAREDVDRALEQIALAEPVVVDFVERNDLSAGVRILVDGARIDATTEGVLADARAIEAEFLAEYERDAPAAVEGASGNADE